MRKTPSATTTDGQKIAGFTLERRDLEQNREPEREHGEREQLAGVADGERSRRFGRMPSRSAAARPGAVATSARSCGTTTHSAA